MIEGVQSLKDVKYWRGQIGRALETRRLHEVWWEANLKAYAPSVAQQPDQYGTCVNTNRDFTLVERKKADLFYQRPDVTLQPTPLLAGQEASLQTHQEIVNEKLGPDGINATRMAHSTLFDVLCTQGVGFTKMGYESVTVDVEQPDPAWQPNPLIPAEMQQPPMVTVPVPIHEQCFWHHFSGKKALIPADFRSTDWDKAPWLGYQFELPLTPGNREKYHLPADFKGAKPDTQQHYDHGGAQDGSGDDVFTGVELWYRSALYREDRPHPDHLTHLVMVDGLDDPAIEEDSPDQTLDERGGLTPDSLIGFPIHPLNMRVLTDSAYPPSDCTLIRPLVNELNRFREQMVEYRDAQTLRWQYNVDTLPLEAVQKIVRSPIGGMIGVPGDAFVGEGAIKELPHGSMPRESFTSNDYIDNDIARTTAIDAAGSGVQSQTNQTATEAQIQQGNANARLDFERGVVLQWYTKGVTKFSTLIQRYTPVEQAAQIVGPERAQAWDQWRKVVPSTLAFTALPDSALRVDQAVDRKQAQDLYTYLANDPNVNRQTLLAKLLRKYHLNPQEIIAQPPPKEPEIPKPSFSFKGEDFSPMSAQSPICIEMAQQMGFKISPQAVQTALALAQMLQAAQVAAGADGQAGSQTQHGGKVAQAEGLDKHAVDLTGGMQGSGAVTPGGAGGMAQ